MMPSENQTTHGAPLSSHCRPLLDSLRRCKTRADLEEIVIAVINILVERNIVRVNRRRGAKKRETEATQALAHPDTDKTNSTGDVNATPAVPKDGHDDASEKSRSEQQQNADQSQAHPENNVHSERDYAAVASRGGK